MTTTASVAPNSIAQSFVAESENQAPITRRFLERVPEAKLTWKPHERSMTVGQLALHLASWPGFFVYYVGNNPAQVRAESGYPQPASHAEILAAFDASPATVRETLPTYDDAAMREPWRLLAGDQEVFAVPRGEFVRDVLFSHLYQHRGQLGVYLRLLDVAVPASYGPSADEVPAFMQGPVKVALD